MELTPQEMTLSVAIEELRSIANALASDLPSGAGYVERLTTIADFLVLFGDVLHEGMGGLAKQLKVE